MTLVANMDLNIFKMLISIINDQLRNKNCIYSMHVCGWKALDEDPEESPEELSDFFFLLFLSLLLRFFPLPLLSESLLLPDSLSTLSKICCNTLSSLSAIPSLSHTKKRRKACAKNLQRISQPKHANKNGTLGQHSNSLRERNTAIWITSFSKEANAKGVEYLIWKPTSI